MGAYRLNRSKYYQPELISNGNDPDFYHETALNQILNRCPTLIQQRPNFRQGQQTQKRRTSGAGRSIANIHLARRSVRSTHNRGRYLWITVAFHGE